MFNGILAQPNIKFIDKKNSSIIECNIQPTTLTMDGSTLCQ